MVREGISRFLCRKSLVAAGTVVLAIIGWGSAGEFARNRDLQSEIDRLDAQAAKIDRRNGELAVQQRRSASNEEIEREARLKLGLQKPGESVIVLRGIQNDRDPNGMERTSENPDSKPSNLKNWWRYFFAKQ